MSKTIHAAGAAILRPCSSGLEVAVVHRGRHDDWTLPKGKVDAGEPLPVTAVRECREETGFRIRLAAPLGRWTYPVGRATKHVDWWRGVLLPDEGSPIDTEEVDRVEWWPVARAITSLTYQQEREVVALAVEQPETTPLVVLRHGKAVDRKDWRGEDAPRPLADVGTDQAVALVNVLDAWGVTRVASSSWARCMATVQPFARTHDVSVTAYDELGEDLARSDPDGVARVIGALRRTTAEGMPTVVCGHRPVLPAMFQALDLPAHPLKPADLVVVHLLADGDVHAAEILRHNGNDRWEL